LPVAAGYTYFTPFQAEIVRAAAARIIPTDEHGPGATEAGVIGFIDRQLTSEYGLAGRRYSLGPFGKGAPTQGDQSGLSTRDRYRLGINGLDAYARRVYGDSFAAIGPAEQDRILADVEAGRADGFEGIDPRAFFELLRYHTIAGFFADPARGGNRDMVGWQLIGFPGAQPSYSAWITRYGVQFDEPYRSLGEHHAEFGGHEESRP
jgi:gluconate 2-dehydrogenase gamma chain